MESWRSELYHHGIRGQKWGVRNGPPYPLKAGDHSARERKAGWRTSLSGNATSNTAPQQRSSRRTPQQRSSRRTSPKRSGSFIEKAAKTAIILTEVGTRAAIEADVIKTRRAMGMPLDSTRVKYYGEIGQGATKALSDIWGLDSKGISKHIDKATKTASITTDAKNKISMTRNAHSFRRAMGLPPSAADILYYADTVKEATKDVTDLYSRSGRFNSANNKPDRKSNSKLKTISSPKEPVELHENKNSFIVDFASAVNPKMKSEWSKTKDYSITDKNGKRIGNMTTHIEDDGTTMNGVWLGVSKKNRGQGYAQSALRLVLDDARKQGMKAFTLEVPGDSPDARHIYEKMGFKETKDAMIGDEDDVWGGLTRMRLEL